MTRVVAVSGSPKMEKGNTERITTCAVEVKGVSKSFGNVEALTDVSFSVNEGEVFGYLGPNGSGKTTTVRVLATLIMPTRGSATVFGYDVQDESLKVRECIGLVQQGLSYEPYLSVLKNITLYGYVYGLSKREIISTSEEVIQLFGLSEYVNRKAVELSLGLKRRLQIAREFVRSPRLLFLDEPTVGLDPEAKRLTLDLIRKKANGGMTVFFTTHNMSEAEYLCDRVAIIERGRLLVVDTPESLKIRTGKDNLEDAYLEIIRRNRHDGNLR